MKEYQKLPTQLSLAEAKLKLGPLFSAGSHDTKDSGTVLNNTSQSTGGTTSSGNTNMSSSLKSALASAQSALADSQAALKKGDFTAYGKAQDRLKAAIAAAIGWIASEEREDGLGVAASWSAGC